MKKHGSEVAQENADTVRLDWIFQKRAKVECYAPPVLGVGVFVGSHDFWSKTIRGAIDQARGGAESAAAREPSQEKLLKVVSECSIEAGIGIGQAGLLELIGQPPLGSHPDEWRPRAATWHQERLNWIAEVERLCAAARVEPTTAKDLEGATQATMGLQSAETGYPLVDCHSRLSKRVEQLYFAENLIRLLVSSSQSGIRDHDLEITGIDFCDRLGFRSNASLGATSAAQTARRELLSNEADQTQEYKVVRFRDGKQMAESGRVFAVSEDDALEKGRNLFPDCPWDAFRVSLISTATPPAPGLPDAATSLLPCPFCGKISYGDGDEVAPRVACETKGCAIEGTAIHPNDWNTRASLPASPWIRTAELAPTAKDGDDLGDVFAIRFQPNGQIDKPKFRHWSGVVGFARLYPFWMPIPPLPASLPTKPTQ